MCAVATRERAVTNLHHLHRPTPCHLVLEDRLSALAPTTQRRPHVLPQTASPHDQYYWVQCTVQHGYHVVAGIEEDGVGVLAPQLVDEESGVQPQHDQGEGGDDEESS